MDYAIWLTIGLAAFAALAGISSALYKESLQSPPLGLSLHGSEGTIADLARILLYSLCKC